MSEEKSNKISSKRKIELKAISEWIGEGDRVLERLDRKSVV